MDDEHLQAWLLDPNEGNYLLGRVQEGLGWVDEKNLQIMADNRPDRIYYFMWSTETED